MRTARGITSRSSPWRIPRHAISGGGSTFRRDVSTSDLAHAALARSTCTDSRSCSALDWWPQVASPGFLGVGDAAKARAFGVDVTLCLLGLERGTLVSREVGVAELLVNPPLLDLRPRRALEAFPHQQLVGDVPRGSSGPPSAVAANGTTGVAGDGALSSSSLSSLSYSL